MTASGFSPRQIRLLQIMGVCLVFFTMLVGLYYQVMGLKLDGGILIVVGITIINFLNLFQAQLREASARIDQLEKKLAAR